MPHPVVGKKPNRDVATGEEKSISGGSYTGEVFVNRKQIWKGRAASYEEAERNARAEANKHPNARTTVVVRSTKTRGT